MRSACGGRVRWVSAAASASGSRGEPPSDEELQPGAMRRWPLQADEMAAFAVRASDDVLGGGFGFRRFRSILSQFSTDFRKKIPKF
jgi:hypothetical protein